MGADDGTPLPPRQLIVVASGLRKVGALCQTYRSMNKPLLLSLLAASSLIAADRIKLTPAWPNVTIDKPISLVVPPDGSGRQFLVQQRGLILLLPKDEASGETKTFLDLTGIGMEASKQSQFEEGLLGLAFHPKFKDNGKLYICHSAQEPKRSVYAEYQVSKSNPDQVDPATKRVLLEIPQPYWNHHCGNLAFGPDGLLYIPMGDGGGMPGGDPFRHGQNLFALNGKVLRIDVDRTQGARAYGIPQDNPFVGQQAVREEIYAYGLRNPWGIHIEADGTFWLADVGQELWEEVNLITKGGNYGWSWREGKGEYLARTGQTPPEGSQFIDPIHAYDHTQGISITGGVVYTGSKLPDLKGSYIYGDWGYGSMWAIKYDKAAKKLASNTSILAPQLGATAKNGKPTYIVRPSGIYEDANHEIVVLDWAGKAWHVEAN
jgi:quinoprotein glucose dehydrogenase